MNTSAAGDQQPQLARVGTGVPGLDDVLNGGFYEGAVYIIRGTPGAGKTIFANQVCFHHARSGGRALFVTLLAENHARMLQHLSQLSFFDAGMIPKQIYYVSAFRLLEEDGLKGLMELLRREMRAHEATVLVLDGLIAVEETSTSDREFRKFIHELQAHAAMAGCCTLLLTNGRRGDYYPEHTMVDGLVTLEDVSYGKRRQRELEVLKFRGSSSLRGRHPFRITDDGLTVYPRPESRFHRNDAKDSDRRLSTGIAQLDSMLHGGVLENSVSVLLGASGAGKTTIGTYFLSESSKSEPGLHFGFYESPAQLSANASRLNLDLKRKVDAGQLEILWRPPVERILDSIGNEIIDRVRARKVKRFFVDGWGGFVAAAETAERVPPFFAALVNELRSLGVTTICAIETENLVGPEINVPIQGISAITDNMILLRFTEYRAQLYRLISIMKARGGSFDPRVRDFQIGAEGVKIADNLADAEQLLSSFSVTSGSGSAHPANRSTGRSKTTAKAKAKAKSKSKARRRG